MLNKGNIEQVYKLAPVQEGILFHSLLDEHKGQYFDQIKWDISGPLDVAVLESCFEQLFARHQILRAAYVHEGFDQPLQVILKNRKGVFNFHEASVEEVPIFIDEDRSSYFDLQKDPLMRMTILKHTADHFTIIWS